MGIGTFLCDKSFASLDIYKTVGLENPQLCVDGALDLAMNMVRNYHGRWLRLVEKVMEKKLEKRGRDRGREKIKQ
jgi:hypothetical protein